MKNTYDDNKVLDPQQIDIFGGDYLELDDLAEPLSHSSSSDNSRGSSMSFDEYFDPVALLQVLENDSSNQVHQGKDSSSKCRATASIRPFEMVMQPPAPSSMSKFFLAFYIIVNQLMHLFACFCSFLVHSC